MAARLAANPSLFDRGPAPDLPDQNSPRTALDWLDIVRVRAAITPEPGMPVCPFCDSLDVCPPLTAVDHCCLNCGARWGDISRPGLAS